MVSIYTSSNTWSLYSCWYNPTYEQHQAENYNLRTQHWKCYIQTYKIGNILHLMLFCPSVSVLVCLILFRHFAHIRLIIFNLCILCFPSIYLSTVCGDWVYFVFIYYGYQFSRIPIVIWYYLVSIFLIYYLVTTNYISVHTKYKMYFFHCDVIYICLYGFIKNKWFK